MMQICYDGQGKILFTVDGDEVPAGLDGNWLAYDGAALGNLTCWRVVAGALVLVDLNPAKAVARARINNLIDAARAPYVTDIAGQEAIYAEKAKEAVAYVAAILPDLSDYPFISAEIGITAPDAYALAQVWLNMVALLRAVGAQSEQVRLGAIGQINAATSLAEIEAVLGAFD